MEPNNFLNIENLLDIKSAGHHSTEKAPVNCGEKVTSTPTL